MQALAHKGGSISTLMSTVLCRIASLALPSCTSEGKTKALTRFNKFQLLQSPDHLQLSA